MADAEQFSARGSTAAEFAQARFGGPTRLRDRTVSVLTSATELFPNDPRRVAWLAMNRSVNNGAVGFDNEVTAANGIKCGADGGVASMDVQEDGEVVTYRVVAISEAATGTWRVIEVLRV